MRRSPLRALVPAIVLALGAASCTDATQSLAPEAGALHSMVVTTSSDATTLILGRQIQLAVDVTNPSGKEKENKEVVWTSSDDAVATVTEGGLVQGRSVGEALVIAAHKKEVDTVRVTVIPKPVAAVAVSPAVATGYPNAVVAFSAQALDDSSQVLEGRALTWSTADATIASVDEDGLVTLLKAGSTKVRATADNGVFGEGSVTVEALSLIISEVMPNPAKVVDELGEWFEVYNPGSNPVDLKGWRITSNDRVGGPTGPFLVHTVGASVIVPAKGYAVLGVNADQTTNGGVPVAYSYAATTGATLNMNNTNSDWLVLRTPSNGVADSVAWGPRATPTSAPTGSSVPNGMSRMVVDLALDNTIVNGSNWVTATASQTYGLGDRGTPTSASTGAGGGNNGGGNNGGGTGAGPVAAVRVNGVSIPVGFQTQLFATTTDASGATVQTTVAWASSNPSIVTVNPATGLITGKATGSASITATANGVSGQGTVVITTPTASTTAIYRNHLEFGAPVDATPGDEFSIKREQYVLSYNAARGGPNWVSWNLNATHFGTTSRCNCFSADPALEAAGITPIVTSDYTGGGFDRGHMVMSDQRSAATLENATTFYLTNILPQTADNNQGPWLAFESYNSNLAESTTAPKELYIVAGGAGYTVATVNNAGKIAIPGSTWKIVVVLPAGQGLASVTSVNDLQVIAINIPNSTGAAFKATTWQTYKVSVDVVEALTGYDFLSALPDEIETAVEASVAP